jgi:hypothetical protein
MNALSNQRQLVGHPTPPKNRDPAWFTTTAAQRNKRVVEAAKAQAQAAESAEKQNSELVAA